MNNRKSEFIIAIIFFAMLTSCMKDHIWQDRSYRDKLYSQLESSEEQNFFDRRFIIESNPYIMERVRSRNEEHELLDSLYNYLIQLQITNPYVEELIFNVGYPFWVEAKYHAIDSLRPCFTIPTAGLQDSITQGIITSVLDTTGIWFSSYISRDTVITLTTSSDENLGAYLLGLIYYDYMLFGNIDSVLSVMYNSVNENIMAPSINILPRTTECIVFTQTLTYYVWEGCAFQENEVVARDPCGYWEEHNEDWNEIFCFEGGSGGPGVPSVSSGSPIGGNTGGGGTGGTGGGGTGGGSGGSGGWLNCGTCGCTPNLVPLLCSGSGYSAEFIGLYNWIVNYLTISQANWLLENGNIYLLRDFKDYIRSYTPDLILGGQLLGLWIDYIEDEDVTDPMSKEDLAQLIIPYVNEIKGYEMIWLIEHAEVLNEDGIENYLALLSNNTIPFTYFGSEYLNWAYELMNDNDFDVKSTLFADDAFTVLQEYPDVKMERCGELYELLKADPYALIRPCVEESDPYPISFWSDVATFTPNSSVLDKVEEDGYEMQFIQNTSTSAAVNLDYFILPISQMPKKVNGQRMTNEELINYFRLNINQYSDFPVYGVTFSPIIDDSDLWASSNPLGSIVEIDITFDDGAVVCSDYSSCCWVFSTLKEPGLFSRMGSHPVSGNRQFGINGNGGNPFLYIKGVDMANNVLSKIVGYSAGDALWSGTLGNFKQWVEEPTQDGQFGQLGFTYKRPSFDSAKQALMSNSPLQSIPCD